MTTDRKPTFWQWLSSMPDYPEYEDYQSRGGHLSYHQWKMQGKPKATVSAQPEWLTPRTRGIMATPEYAEAEAARRAGLPIPGGAGAAKPEEPVTPLGGEITPRKPTTLEEAKERLSFFETEYGRGSYYLDYDDENGSWTVKRDPEYFKQKRQENAYPLQPGQPQTYTDSTGKVMGYDADTNSYIQIGYDQTKDQSYRPEGWISPEAQGELDLKREQMTQEAKASADLMGWYREEAGMRQQEQERQYISQLMANPMSWLQYNAYTGETPTVQPWMKPLMSEQYQIGQQIPGWMGGQPGVQGEGQPMGSLPELRTPSAQLWGRMGPTAQAQYMGYGQARTGSRPEETAFRLRATAPPSGRFSGLRRMR